MLMLGVCVSVYCSYFALRHSRVRVRIFSNQTKINEKVHKNAAAIIVSYNNSSSNSISNCKCLLVKRVCVGVYTYIPSTI